MDHEPQKDCLRCPRLVAFRRANQDKYPSFFNGAVPSFGPETAAILVVGLAPGLKGANQTGRPFTGDYAGDLLYDVLLQSGLAHGDYGRMASDALTLTHCRITNAVRCVPPQNKVTGDEAKNCRSFLIETLNRMPNLRVILALGKVAHDATLRALGQKLSAYTFGHMACHTLPGGLTLIDSYHCSRYNVNTGRLTRAMFLDAVSLCKEQAGLQP